MRLDGLSNTYSLVQSGYIYLPAVQILLDITFLVRLCMAGSGWCRQTKLAVHATRTLTAGASMNNSKTTRLTAFNAPRPVSLTSCQDRAEKQTAHHLGPRANQGLQVGCQAYKQQQVMV